MQPQKTEDIAQLVRASDCGSEGRGFETLYPPKEKPDILNVRLLVFKAQSKPLPCCIFFYLYALYKPFHLPVLQVMKQLLILLGIVGGVFASCNSSEEKEKQLLAHLIALHEVSKTKGYLAKQVWAVAIQYNKYALTTSSQYRDIYMPDYETALAKMETENDIKIYNDKIDSLALLTQKELGELGSKKPKAYAKLALLHNKVAELGKKARRPSADTINAYINELRILDNTISKLIAELKFLYQV